MTGLQLEELRSQQIAIIDMFRREAGATVSRLKLQMVALQAETNANNPGALLPASTGRRHRPIQPRPVPALAANRATQKAFQRRFGHFLPAKFLLVKPRRPPFRFVSARGPAL
jgi:hypothetical protein